MSEEQRHLSQFTETGYNLWPCSECHAVPAYLALLCGPSQPSQGRWQAESAEMPQQTCGSVSRSLCVPVNPKTCGQRALESICIAEVSTPFVMFTQ